MELIVFNVIEYNVKYVTTGTIYFQQTSDCVNYLQLINECTDIPMQSNVDNCDYLTLIGDDYLQLIDEPESNHERDQTSHNNNRTPDDSYLSSTFVTDLLSFEVIILLTYAQS